MCPFCTGYSHCYLHSSRLRFSVSKPPRVYHLAQALNYKSDDMVTYLSAYYGFRGRTPSSPVPLSLALQVIQERYVVSQ